MSGIDNASLLDKSHSDFRAEGSLKRLFSVLKWSAVCAPVLYLVVLILYFYNFDGKLSPENADWGTFGDFVGGTLNPLFSLIAFLGLLYTILLQSKELRESNNALKTQNEHWEFQNYQSAFFSVLNIYNDSLSRLRVFLTVEGEGKNYEGYEALIAVDKTLSDYIIRLEDGNPDAKLFPMLRRFFNDKSNKNSIDFIAKYCSVINKVVVFFDSYDIDDMQKDKFVSYFSNTLDGEGMMVLFFAAIYYSNREGVDDSLLKKYKIFRSLTFINFPDDYQKWLKEFIE